MKIRWQENGKWLEGDVESARVNVEVSYEADNGLPKGVGPSPTQTRDLNRQLLRNAHEVMSNVSAERDELGRQLNDALTTIEQIKALCISELTNTPLGES